MPRSKPTAKLNNYFTRKRFSKACAKSEAPFRTWNLGTDKNCDRHPIVCFSLFISTNHVSAFPSYDSLSDFAICIFCILWQAITVALFHLWSYLMTANQISPFAFYDSQSPWPFSTLNLDCRSIKSVSHRSQRVILLYICEFFYYIFVTYFGRRKTVDFCDLGI